MLGIRLFLVKKVLRRVKNNAKYTDILKARRGFEHLVGHRNKPLKGFKYEATVIGEMKAEWITPDGADEKKVLLYFHGGGYAVGSPNTHRGLISQIAKNAGIKALAIDYRLAPENKYPAPIEDAVAAFQFLLGHGYRAKDICFGGDSAGGGVNIGTLCYLRDKNLPLPKCVIALSPWLDLTLTSNAYRDNRHIDPMLTHEAFPLWIKNYLGDADSKSPYASPIFHSLKDLPPVMIQVGEEELLLDDSTTFATKAKAEGVDVRIEVYPKKFHVFNAFWQVLPKAREANKKLGEFLKSQLYAQS